ncbi:gamma-glutamyl-phosphate reductase, partial [Xanthomonas citri pv. citri]|nr:gamma-glutamyl-phosphate reductase [Xanthomonas citri pv. citri]
AAAGTGEKDRALESICQTILARQEDILSANREDLKAAEEAGMIPALMDRLTLTPQRIEGMIEGVRQVAALPDPIGQV